MTELRLLPPAVVAWAVTLVVILAGWPWALPILAAALLFRRGQALLSAAVGAAALAVTALRAARARAFDFGAHISGTLVADPVPLSGGGSLLRVRVPGFPPPLPVFVREELPLAAGSPVEIDAAFSESARPGISPVVAAGEVTAYADPSGWAHVVAGNFRAAVEDYVGPASQGLLPGMVLGDTSLQTEAEKQLYLSTGLSHLSAVSGANVAIVCTMAVLACAALGPRMKAAAAACALCGFVLLVGFDPSVQRAAVAGMVGVLAVLRSSRMEPLHALCLGIIGLLLIDSDLAVSLGFALSCAATAGIVVLSPVLRRIIGRTGWPDILVRALAVAIAADMVTMPLVALMTGRVSVVSILANVLVAPATTPVTVLGLVAAALAQLWPPGASAVLTLVEPFTWWINAVARGCATLPVAATSGSAAGVLLAYGWIVAGLWLGRPRLTALAAVAAVVCAQGVPVDVGKQRVHAVEAEEDIFPVPPGTQIVVVREQGSAHDRPVRLPDGTPVLYPARDGLVRLYRDGTQHAANGRF